MSPAPLHAFSLDALNTKGQDPSMLCHPGAFLAASFITARVFLFKEATFHFGAQMRSFLNVRPAVSGR